MEYVNCRTGAFKSTETRQNMKTVREKILEEKHTLLDEECEGGALL